MRRRSEIVVCQALQHIPDIDHNFPFSRDRWHPVVFEVKYFKSSSAGAYQEGDQVDILMLLSSDR